MTRRFTYIMAAAFACGASTLHAQSNNGRSAPSAPPDGMMMQMHSHADMMPMPNVAEMFLSHTAELQLTDAQVTKLAAIARHIDARHTALHAQMDSVHARLRASMQNGEPTAPPMSEAQMQQIHDQEKADVRDALTVLTPDQLTTVFMMHMHAMHGGPMSGAMGGAMHGAMNGAGFGAHP